MGGFSNGRSRSAASRRAAIGVALLVLATGITDVVPWAEAITSTGDRAIFEPVTPARILDTRTTSQPVGPGESRVLQVTGAGGVATDATAVVLNVTAVTPTADGFLTVYPADASVPVASNVNFTAGQTVPNSVQVKLGSSGADVGKIRIFNFAGQTHVIVDVAGFFRGHDHDDRYYTKAQSQARIAANSLTCPTGQFLNSVAADGTPTCASGATGPASGDLVGTYPAPSLGSKVVAAPQLDVLPVAVARSATQPLIPNTGVFTDVTMNFEDIDSTGTMHDTSTNTHRMVAPLRGLYDITIQVRWNGGNYFVDGYRSIRTNPGLIASTQPMIQSINGVDVTSASGVVFLEQGGTIELEAATINSSFVTGMMSMQFISPFCPAPTQVCAPLA